MILGRFCSCSGFFTVIYMKIMVYKCEQNVNGAFLPFGLLVGLMQLPLRGAKLECLSFRGAHVACGIYSNGECDFGLVSLPGERFHAAVGAR